MKTTITLCLVAACLAPVILRAAADTPEVPTAAPADPAFNLKFPGGSVRTLLETIERQSGQKPNVVCAADVADLPLPSLELRSVRTENIFEALRVVLGEHEPLMFARLGNVYALQHRSVPTGSRVYYVGDLLTKFKVQDITTSIQTAWEMSGSSVKAQLKYHEETQLLIVLADMAQQGTIKNVLEELRLALVPAGGPGASNSKLAPAPSAKH